MSSISGRTRHYGDFYQLPDGTGVNRRADDRPRLVVYGNCQAEAVRVLLESSESLGLHTIRIPPVFELTAADIPFLQQTIRDSQFLISQTVADDYHDLPLGTHQVAAMMAPGSAVIRWPVIRFAGLHPFQVTVRDPGVAAGNPPVVDYHDLRTLASARTGQDRWSVEVDPAALAAVADESRNELRRREARNGDVIISDVFEHLRADDMATINHPGNRVLLAMAHRVQEALGRPADATEPDRTLLGEVLTPVSNSVLTALGASGASRKSWRVSGRRVLAPTVHRAQWRWYEKHPAVVEEGCRRYRDVLDAVGLA